VGAVVWWWVLWCGGGCCRVVDASRLLYSTRMLLWYVSLSQVHILMSKEGSGHTVTNISFFSVLCTLGVKSIDQKCCKPVNMTIQLPHTHLPALTRSFMAARED